MPDYIAIGDIHGMDDALEALLSRVPSEGELVFLGDYVDRGPQTRSVLERLLRLRDDRPCVFLRGNHEELMLAACDGLPDADANWLMNGGLQTLESYNGRPPDDHIAFLRQTLPYYETETYIFVHAGLLPGVPLAATGPEVYLWVRDSFLAASYDWGRLVVHGHSPMISGIPDIRSNRINIDTAAVYGGALTALLLPECTSISIPTNP